MSYLILLLFFAVEYVRPTSYVPALMPLHLNSIIPVGAFIGSLASGATQRASRWMWSDLNSRAVLTFLGLLLVSVFTATVRMYAWDRFTATVGYAIITLVLTSELTSIGRIKGVFLALIVVHLMVAALNPVLFTNPDQRNYLASGSFLGDGNDFALSVNIAVPFCLFLFLNGKAWQKPLLMASMLVMIACVVLSQSRGGTLALGAMGIYYWIGSPKKVQTGLMAAVVVGLILALAPGSYFTRMEMMGDTSEGSAAARIEAWKAGARMAASNPLLGVGAGNFPTAFDTTFRPAGYEGPGKTAHSVYFLALGELGVPGIGVILYFLISNLKANRRLSQEVSARLGASAIEVQLLSATSAALISFAVAGAFLSALYYPHWFVLAGVMGATREVIRQRALEGATDVVPAARPQTVTVHPMLRRPSVPAAAIRQQLSR